MATWTMDNFKPRRRTEEAEQRRDAMLTQEPISDHTQREQAALEQMASEGYDRTKNAAAMDYRRQADELARPTYDPNNENAKKSSEYFTQYMDREPFSYDVNADALYQQYKQQYMNQGNMAMRDTVGKVSAQTGGYANSYAAAAGQQVYQDYLTRLNDVVPELEQLAYSRYQDEGNRLKEASDFYANQDERQYGMYRDSMADFDNDRARLDELYRYEDTMGIEQFNNNRDFLYQQFVNDRNFDYESWMQQMQLYDEIYNTDYAADFQEWYAMQQMAQNQAQFDANLAENQRQFDANLSYNYSKSGGGSGGGGSGGGSRSYSGYYPTSDDDYVTPVEEKPEDSGAMKSDQEYMDDRKENGNKNAGGSYYTAIKKDIEDMSDEDAKEYIKQQWSQGNLTTAEYSSLFNMIRDR